MWSTFVVSSDHQHYAFVTNGLSGASVDWDGRIGTAYDQIDAGPLRLSDDGQHLAYFARKGNQWTIVQDGGEVFSADEPTQLALSPDGMHLAYVLGSGTDDVMIVDGKPGNHYAFLGAPVFSPDSQHVAYGVHSELSPGKLVSLVVRDGREGKPYDLVEMTRLVFSPDSKHLAYTVTRDDGAGRSQLVVTDDTEHKGYEQIETGSVHFSPNSSRLAYAAFFHEQWFVVADDKEGTHWDQGCLCPGLSFGFIPSFSPDGQHLAYYVATRSGWYAVIDGIVGKAYASILINTPVFSPDGRHSAYMARVADGWLLVVDDKEFDANRYESPYSGMLTFSPDSRHIVYGVATGGLASMVVDGQTGNIYNAIVTAPIFDAPDHMAYLAQRGDQIVYVQETLPGPLALPQPNATAVVAAVVPLSAIFKYAIDFDLKGTGPVSFASRDYPVYHFRPLEYPKNIAFVKTLTLHVIFDQKAGNPPPTLDFMLYSFDGGGWTANGGRNKFNWGTNDINLQYPDFNVSRKGDVYISIRNYGQQTIKVQSINFTLQVDNTDGTSSTYQPIGKP